MHSVMLLCIPTPSSVLRCLSRTVRPLCPTGGWRDVRAPSRLHLPVAGWGAPTSSATMPSGPSGRPPAPASTCPSSERPCMVQHEGCFCAPAVSRRSPARAAAGNGLTLLPARAKLYRLKAAKYVLVRWMCSLHRAAGALAGRRAEARGAKAPTSASAEGTSAAFGTPNVLRTHARARRATARCWLAAPACRRRNAHG